MIILPITNQPNQTFSVKVPVGDLNLNLQFYVYWNNIAEYWQLSILNLDTGVKLIDGLPMVRGLAPAGNILHQFEYMGIGSAYLVALNATPDKDYPGLGDWDTNFVLLWGN